MKITTKKDAIISALSKVQSIVSSRTTLPILYNVHVLADKDGLTLTATDLEISVRATVPAGDALKIGRTGETTLPAKRLYNILAAMPAAEIELDVDGKDVAAISAGSSRFKIIGINAAEFPALPKFESSRTFAMKQCEAKRMLSVVSCAASTDESRVVLNGVLLSFRDSCLTMVATDGRRLAQHRLEMDVPLSAEVDLVVPSKTVGELLKTLSDGALEIRANDNQIGFKFGAVEIISKLIEGTYPNFRQVIPAGCKERVDAPREELLAAAHRVSLLVADKAIPITLKFADNQIEVRGVAQDIGEAEDSVAVKYGGKETSISFNPSFLMDPLKQLDIADVSIELTDELSPAVLKAGDFLYVLMPMRTR